MILTLICKKRETEDGKKWVNFSMVKGKTWYNVKFVKECAPPQMHKIADGVVRAFIRLTETDKYDITDKIKNKTLFIESYSDLTNEELATIVAAETKKVEDYRAAREKARIDFLDDGTKDIPF